MLIAAIDVIEVCAQIGGKSGKARRYYEWDYTEGEIEVYDKDGNHLGVADPVTGKVDPSKRKPGREMHDD